jgi:hypothetical protein
MKRFIFVTLFALLVMALTVPAQITSQKIHKSQTEYSFTISGNLDSLNKSPGYDSAWTQEVGYQDFNAVTNFSILYSFVCAAGAPKYRVEAWGSPDNVTYTKFATVIDTATTETTTWTYSALGSIRPPYLKFLIFQLATGRDNAVYTFRFYAAEGDKGYLYGPVGR